MKRMMGLASVFTCLATMLAACSPAIESAESDCKGSGCKKRASAPAAATAPLEVAPGAVAPPPLPTVPPPALPDAGATKPPIPPPNYACPDLQVCCNQVQSMIERAGCLLIAQDQDPAACANATLAYQAYGGCAHSGSGMPDIFNPGGSINHSRNCAYLQQACAYDPSQCPASYQCAGAGLGGTGNGYDRCANHPDPWCCRNPGNFMCYGGSPTPPPGDCTYAVDRFCCENPTSPSCFMGPPPPPPPPFDCTYAADPYCCEFPECCEYPYCI